MIYETLSEEETFNLGEEFAKNIKKGDIICLTGEVGVGKTYFTKGLAKGLNINQDILSPTFTIVNQYYGGSLPLFHFDLYKIKSIEEIYQIGYEEYFFGQGVCIVEWPQIAKELIPFNSIWIDIKKDTFKDKNYRKIEVSR